MKTSAIVHNPSVRYLKLYADFIAICAYESESPKKGIVIKNDDCAAALLALYENFHNSEKGDRFSNSFLEKCLQYHYSPKTIIEANKLLEYEGYIVITRNKISETENAPNSISLNVKAINEQLAKMLELRVEKEKGEYFYPTVILHNPYRKFTEPYRKITENKNNSNNNSNHKEEAIVASDAPSFPNPSEQTQPNQLRLEQKKESHPPIPLAPPPLKTKAASEIPTKIVLAHFDNLILQLGISYTYPKSAAAWKPIHTCCKQIYNEVGAEGLKVFFAKIESMCASEVFPFKDKTSITPVFIGSAKVIGMIANYEMIGTAYEAQHFFKLKAEDGIAWRKLHKHLLDVGYTNIMYNNEIVNMAKGGIPCEDGLPKTFDSITFKKLRETNPQRANYYAATRQQQQ